MAEEAATQWLAPKLLLFIGVQMALSTRFAEFFDRRDAYLERLNQGEASHRPRRGVPEPGSAAAAPRGDLHRPPPGGVQTVAATDDVPTVVDAIQYETGEGPCLTAIYQHAT